MNAGSKEDILAAAKRSAMAHGYTGLNFRDIAAEVGIKAPSIYHHFPTKADLGAAVAKRYWEDIIVDLEAISDQLPDPLRALRRYPEIFRKSLLSDNRMCLCSFMAAEYDDLPETVKKEDLLKEGHRKHLLGIIPIPGSEAAKTGTSSSK